MTDEMSAKYEQVIEFLDRITTRSHGGVTLEPADIVMLTECVAQLRHLRAGKEMAAMEARNAGILLGRMEERVVTLTDALIANLTAKFSIDLATLADRAAECVWQESPEISYGQVRDAIYATVAAGPDATINKITKIAKAMANR